MYLNLLLYQLVLASFMTGLIWIVQLVHYPAFEFADNERFKEFNVFHQSRISLVVLPAMLLELTCAISLTWLRPSDQFNLINLLILGVIWIATFFIFVPIHGELLINRNADKMKKLVNYNWIRTTLWTTRCFLSFLILRNFLLT